MHVRNYIILQRLYICSVICISMSDQPYTYVRTLYARMNKETHAILATDQGQHALLFRYL